jgi:hypothetical protein
MRYIFFCFYNSQYLDGKNSIDKAPWFTAVSMMFAGSFFCLMILAEILHFYILNQNIPSYSHFIIIGTLLCSHYYFFYKEQKIQFYI